MVWHRLQGPADMDWSYNGPCLRWRKTSAAVIFTTPQGSGDCYCTWRNTIQVTQMVKTFLQHACTTHISVQWALSNPWQYCTATWMMSCICSMCTHRQQRLLFCLFVADRAWVLLAVRPSIHKAILSLIDGDPLNYRLKQERQQQKTTLVKVS